MVKRILLIRTTTNGSGLMTFSTRRLVHDRRHRACRDRCVFQPKPWKPLPPDLSGPHPVIRPAGLCPLLRDDFRPQRSGHGLLALTYLEAHGSSRGQGCAELRIAYLCPLETSCTNNLRGSPASKPGLRAQQGHPASDGPAQQVAHRGVGGPASRSALSSSAPAGSGRFDLGSKAVGWGDACSRSHGRSANSKGSCPDGVLRCWVLSCWQWQRAPQPQHPVRPARLDRFELAKTRSACSSEFSSHAGPCGGKRTSSHCSRPTA